MTDATPGRSSYGKRPLWQWVLLYVIAGAIVYGFIYYMVLAKNGGYQSGIDTPGAARRPLYGQNGQ